MLELSIPRWILLFFLYCFVGWIWECTLCSFTQKEFVNRGFLYGPWLPIYGFGAITILASTLVFDSYPILVAFIGMTFATILEYATGAAMERMFHMRYWDYSDCFMNVKGYICLKASLCWAVFSVLLVYVINIPFLTCINKIKDMYLHPIVSILLIAFGIDYCFSIQAAIRIRHLVDKLANESKFVHLMHDKIHELEGMVHEKSELYEQHIHELQAEFTQHKNQLLHELAESDLYKYNLQARIERIRTHQRNVVQQFNKIITQLDLISEHIDTVKDQSRQEFKKGIQLTKQSINELSKSMNSNTDKDYQELIKFITKHPTAKAVHPSESLYYLRIHKKTNPPTKKS